jgi:hypothetical protein
VSEKNKKKRRRKEKRGRAGGCSVGWPRWPRASRARGRAVRPAGPVRPSSVRRPFFFFLTILKTVLILGLQNSQQKYGKIRKKTYSFTEHLGTYFLV